MSLSTRLGHPRGDARHQAVVIDPVEELLQIDVNHEAVTLGNVALRLGHGLMGGASRSEAVTVLGKRRIPPRLKDLQQGLLDQPVDDARHAELSDPALRLGDLDPLDRLWLVGSLEQLRPNAWPVLTQVIPGVVDGHPIHAGAALVSSNAFPRSFKVLSVAHLLHLLFRCGRAFGFWRRREWFGPLIAADRGFTPVHRFQGQCVLDLLPRSTHESPVLLATPDRSGLRPSFPARPIRCSAFRPWSASRALPTAWPTMPSADSCAAVRSPCGSLSSKLGTRRRPPQVSPIAFPAHLPDLQPWSLMDLDFAIRRPLVRPRMPHIRFLFVRSRFCSTLPSDATSR